MFSRTSSPRILPFAVYLFFLFLADVLLRAGVDAQTLRWLYPVKILGIAGVLWALRSAYIELRFPQDAGAETWITAVVTGAIVFIAWINLNAGWMVIGQSDGFDPSGDAGVNFWLVAIRIAGAAIIVPIIEELFWRSFLMRWIEDADFLNLAPARVGVRGFLVVALFFASEHNLWLAGIVAGIAYNWLYIRSGTLWSPILAHAVTNGLLGAWVVKTGNWAYW